MRVLSAGFGLLLLLLSGCEATTPNLVIEGPCTLVSSDEDTQDVLTPPIVIAMKNGSGPDENPWIRAVLLYGASGWRGSLQTTLLHPDGSVEEVGISGASLNQGRSGMEFALPGEYHVRVESDARSNYDYCRADFAVQVMPWDGAPRR